MSAGVIAIAGIVVTIILAVIGWIIIASYRRQDKIRVQRDTDLRKLEALRTLIDEWWDKLNDLTTREQAVNFDARQVYEPRLDNCLNDLGSEYYQIALLAGKFRAEAIRYKLGTRLTQANRTKLEMMYNQLKNEIFSESNRLRKK